MKREIWLIKDKDECYDVNTGEAVPFLIYYDPDWPPSPDAEIIKKDAHDASLEELCVFCDHDAENCNAHDCCGMHRVLGGLLYKQLGREKATITMREIAEHGGLHGLAGLRGDGSYAKFNAGEAGRDWDGRFGP